MRILSIARFVTILVLLLWQANSVAVPQDDTKLSIDYNSHYEMAESCFENKDWMCSSIHYGIVYFGRNVAEISVNGDFFEKFGISMMLSAASEELPLKNEQRAIFASDSIKAFKASGDENFRYVLMANLLVLKYAKQCSSRYLEALSLYQENKSAMIDKLDKDFHDELKDRYEAVISTSDCDPKPQADSLRR